MSRTLTSHPNYVLNAFAQFAQIAYEPENIRLGAYTFLPWARTGLSSIVQNPAAGEVRATVTVTVDVEDDKGGRTPVSKTLTLRGPGDVLGLQTSQIVRRYPAPNATDAQDTYLAYVEFDRPELPWLFTPFAPSGPDESRLIPWLALVVLEVRRARFEAPPPSSPPLPLRVWARKSELQPLNHSWAFAHAQVMGDTGVHDNVSVRADGAPGVAPDDATPSVRDRLTDEYAPVNLSRLLCPRRLDDGVDYVACVVPAFDVGVQTGLGLSGGTLGPAWTRSPGDEDQEVLLPVYDHWRFSTARGGDFEELARRLVPIKAPWKVGRRFIDAHLPRGGVPELAPNAHGRVQVLKCALFSPSVAPPGVPDETADWSMAKREELRDEIERGDATALQPVAASVALPKVGTRLYARFQRGQGRIGPINDSDWFDQLNTTPTHRIVAGLGTRVVRNDQEQLMQSAWAQVGAIDKANQALVRAQYARYLSASLHDRYLSKLSMTALVQVTRGAQGKVKLRGSSLTIRGDLEQSFVAPQAAGLAFRRATRPRGAVVRFAQGAIGTTLDEAVAPSGSFRDFRRPHLEPDGVTGLRPETLAVLPKNVVASTLGISQRNAIGVLRNRLDVLASEASLADQMSAPVTTWQFDAGSIDVGRVRGMRTLDILDKVAPKTPSKQPVRAEAIGTLYNGMAKSGIEGVHQRAQVQAERITRGLPILTRRQPPVGRRVGRPVSGPTVVRPTRRTVRRGRAATPPPPPPRPVLRQPIADVREPLVSARSVALGMQLRSLRETPTSTIAKSLSVAVGDTGVQALPALVDLKAPAVSQTTLLAQLHPAVTVTAYAQARLKARPPWMAADWFQDGFVQPIMAAPEFKRPMYEALDAYNRDWLVPGLGLIERSDFVTLLMTNAAFTEAFLVGLSDEMGRELLWREYPTDQRGTYFRHFWDDDQDELISPIHRFTQQPLGEHIVGGSEGRVVFVIRGTLVKRFPDAFMFALREVLPTPTGSSAPVFADPTQAGASAEILFHAHLAPDIMLVGFDLTADQVKNQKWWFFIAEHPTAPRFGLDVEGTRAPSGANVLRNDLDWNDVNRTHGNRFVEPSGPPLVVSELPPPPDRPPPPSVNWPPHTSAVLARTFLQNPVRAAYDGSKLLDDINHA